jgi:hypothetical protein
MRIRPGTIVMLLSFALIVYALVAVLAVQRIMHTLCMLRGQTRSVTPTDYTLVVRLVVSGGLGVIAERIASVFVRRHRRNHNQCIKCGWPRTIERPVCAQCGLRHALPMVLESRFDVIRVTDRPRLSLR